MEKFSIKNTIESVITDLSNNEEIKTFALKIKLISHHFKNPDFSNWVNCELEGYNDKTLLPKHRVLQSSVIANLIIDNGVKSASLTNHTMPLSYIKDEEVRKNISFVYILESVISLETIINSLDSQVCYTVTEYERYYLNRIYECSNILSAHKPISKTELEVIIFKFRTKLLEVFLSFNDNIFNDELDFDIMSTKKEIDKVVSQTINAGVYVSENSTANISNSHIIGGGINNINMSSLDKSELESILKQIENISKDLDEERNEIVDEIAKIKNELNNNLQRPKVITSAFNAIKGIAIGISANQITPLATQGIEYIKKLFYLI